MRTMGRGGGGARSAANSCLYGKLPRNQVFSTGTVKTPATLYSGGHSEVGVSHRATPHFLWPERGLPRDPS